MISLCSCRSRSSPDTFDIVSRGESAAPVNHTRAALLQTHFLSLQISARIPDRASDLSISQSAGPPLRIGMAMSWRMAEGAQVGNGRKTVRKRGVVTTIS